MDEMISYILANSYTDREISNKVSQISTNLDWKEAVETYEDIATTYPSPENGWTVNVKNGSTYRYNGTIWDDIGIGSIPLATTSIDGKMSSTDKTNLNNIKAEVETARNGEASLDVRLDATDNKLGNLIGNGLTETDLATAIKNDRSQLSDITQENVKLIKNLTDLTSSLSLGKNLVLLNGTYTLDANITDMSNSIIIEGQNNTIIDGNTKSIVTTGLQNVTFKNLTFQNFNSINLHSCINITFFKCNILNFVTFGINIDNFTNFKFKDCIINGIGSSSTIPSWQGCGIYADTGDGLVVEDCDISHTFGLGSIFHIGIANTYIKRNKIHDTAYRAINFFTGVSTGLIDDNDIWNCGSINPTASGVGCNAIYSNVFGDGSTYDVVVSNNRITNVLENGVEGGFGVIDNNTITGTGIDTVNFPTPSIEGIYPYTSQTRKVSIRNNKIKNTKGCGIKLYSTGNIANFNIIDNIIEDDTINTNNGIDLNSDVSFSDICITGNTVKNKATVVFMPNKPCVDVYVNNNKSVNSGLIVPVVSTIITNDGITPNVITNREFSNWTSSTVLSNWSVSSATLSQIVDSNSYIPKLTVTSGGFNGRITQDIILPKASKIYVIKVYYQGNASLTLKVIPYLIDGTTLDNANARTTTHTDFSTSVWKEATLLVSTTTSKVQLYVGTSSIQNDYVTIKSINDKLIM